VNKIRSLCEASLEHPASFVELMESIKALESDLIPQIDAGLGRVGDIILLFGLCSSSLKTKALLVGLTETIVKLCERIEHQVEPSLWFIYFIISNQWFRTQVKWTGWIFQMPNRLSLMFKAKKMIYLAAQHLNYQVVMIR
jgi:hypothetical protein